MDRKNFIKNCGLTCLGGAVMSAVLQACSSTKILIGKITKNDLIISLSAFETLAGTEKHYKKYVVVHNDMLQFPICVYRHNENEYSALWMRCTHQGAELQVFGDKLRCPAHGSEFGSNGKAQNGPADNNLRTFAIVIQQNQLKISLKAI